MEDAEVADFFTDPEVLNDPHTYFDKLRAQCPVMREPHHGSMIVTGYDEALEVYGAKASSFSSCPAVLGPMAPLPFEPQGDDISEQLRQNRDKFPWATHFITFDQPEHMAHRTILTRLMTHERLKRNGDYMEGLADRLIDGFIERGRCELMADYAQTLVTLVIADLLGVPEEDRDELASTIGPPPGIIDDPENKSAPDPLEYLDRRFTFYFEERRSRPRDDMMSELANARFRDGSEPDIGALVRIATFLFVAGQDTSAKLIAGAFRIMAEQPDLQARLRADRSLIPDFIEETLRVESPSRVNFRLATHSTTLGDVDVPAGTIVTIGVGAVNRDPGRFEEPEAFKLERPGVRDHIAFGRGHHACPGAPLARLEARISIEHFLDRMSDIRLSEAHHGPPGNRHYDYVPTFILNGVSALHLEFDKAR